MEKKSSIPIAQLSQIQQLLDTRLQEAFKVVRAFQREVYKCQGCSLSPLPRPEIADRLASFCPTLYELIARTLLELVPLVQPDDCIRDEQINFYCWPGYHSGLTKSRIFGRFFKEDRQWNFGVGLCFNLTTGRIETYVDSCQARLYHYLLRSQDVRPGDIHKWFCWQRPSDYSPPHNPVGSLTVSIEDVDSSEWDLFRNHQILDLSSYRDTSEEWGEFLSVKVNQLGVVKDERWHFPANRSGEPAGYLAAHRSKMTSLWLHSAFCADEPRWIGRFIQSLVSEEYTRESGEAIRDALGDAVVSDWADRTTGRPRFSSWTNLALRSSLAPVPPAMFPMWPQPGAGDSEVSRTVGSIGFLSSVPLRSVFVSLVHPWVSEVYGMMRDAEVAILLNNHQIEAASTGMLAGPWWAHELKKLIDNGLQTLLRQAPESTPEALRTRYFVLRSIRTLGDLAYAYANGTLSRDQDSIEKQRETFLRPLRALRDSGDLQAAMRSVACEVYSMVARSGGGRIDFLDSEPTSLDAAYLSDEQHRSCLLLVTEAIQSYCQSEGGECVARWRVACCDDHVAIELAGPSRAQRNPASMAFARLKFLLSALGMGQADVEWNDEEATCRYVVTVHLPATRETDSDAEPEHAATEHRQTGGAGRSVFTESELVLPRR